MVSMMVNEIGSSGIPPSGGGGQRPPEGGIPDTKLSSVIEPYLTGAK
jgi:hypothetical protein